MTRRASARCGWVVSGDEVSDAIRTYRDRPTVCWGVFIDSLATYVFRHCDETFDRNREMVLGDRDITRVWSTVRLRVGWVASQGQSASIIRPDIPGDDEGVLKKVFDLRREGLRSSSLRGLAKFER